MDSSASSPGLQSSKHLLRALTPSRTREVRARRPALRAHFPPRLRTPLEQRPDPSPASPSESVSPYPRPRSRPDAFIHRARETASSAPNIQERSQAGGSRSKARYQFAEGGPADAPDEVRPVVRRLRPRTPGATPLAPRGSPSRSCGERAKPVPPAHHRPPLPKRATTARNSSAPP